MREIKFRAWAGKDMHQIGDLQNIASMGDWRIIDKYEVVMQYTGLHDKNGKEIYEGDIYRQYEQVSEVPELPTFFHLFGEHVIVPSELEVIGNIYDNPELLPTNV